jgi:hypothetical protein
MFRRLKKLPVSRQPRPNDHRFSETLCTPLHVLAQISGIDGRRDELCRLVPHLAE